MSTPMISYHHNEQQEYVQGTALGCEGGNINSAYLVLNPQGRGVGRMVLSVGIRRNLSAFFLRSEWV